MQALITTLNALTPAGLAGLLAYIIYLLIKNKKAVETVSDNHLSGLPDLENSVREMSADVRKIVILMDGQQSTLSKLNDHIIYLVARSNRQRSSSENEQN